MGGNSTYISTPSADNSSGMSVLTYNALRLRRTFVLLDCLHGIKKADMLLLEAMSHADVSFQIVLSKIDRVQERDLPGAFEKARYLLETGIGGRRALGEVLAVAADPKRKGEKRKGISELRWSIMAAAGLERWGLK